jgi:hypothetical protein
VHEEEGPARLRTIRRTFVELVVLWFAAFLSAAVIGGVVVIGSFE